MGHRKKVGIFWLSFILSCSCWVSGEATENQDPYLHGQVNLDSSWERTVYLSYIPTFEDLYAMSYDMIIAEAAIDSLGHFSLDIGFLPEEHRIYRLHVVKREDAPTSLTIGGLEENHLFLIANGRDSIRLEANGLRPPFRNITYRNAPVQSAFQAVTDYVNRTTDLAAESNAAKRQFIEEQLNEQLRIIGDTTSHPLISLYAIYLSQFESNHAEHADFYQAYRQKWKRENSAYFSAFRRQLPGRVNYLRIGAFVVAAMSLIGLGYYLGGRRTPGEPAGLKELTVQERKIYELLRQGSTNQEISDACHIGVSTVKSHVSSIYRKLNVKSRKEVINM